MLNFVKVCKSLLCGLDRSCGGWWCCWGAHNFPFPPPVMHSKAPPHRYYVVLQRLEQPAQVFGYLANCLLLHLVCLSTITFLTYELVSISRRMLSALSNRGQRDHVFDCRDHFKQDEPRCYFSRWTPYNVFACSKATAALKLQLKVNVQYISTFFGTGCTVMYTARSCSEVAAWCKQGMSI